MSELKTPFTILGEAVIGGVPPTARRRIDLESTLMDAVYMARLAGQIATDGVNGFPPNSPEAQGTLHYAVTELVAKVEEAGRVFYGEVVK